MKLGDYIRAIGVGVEVITEAEVDKALLDAGQDAPVNLQVGTDNGKPVHLRGVLTTKP